MYTVTSNNTAVMNIVTCMYGYDIPDCNMIYNKNSFNL